MENNTFVLFKIILLSIFSNLKLIIKIYLIVKIINNRSLIIYTEGIFIRIYLKIKIKICKPQIITILLYYSLIKLMHLF